MERLSTRAKTLVFYDGVCGLCDRFVRFVLMRDRRGQIKFAPLQGEMARTLLQPAGHDPANLESILVVADWNGPGQRVLQRSAAVVHAVSELGGGWGVVARLARVVPTFFADAVYTAVARRRYRIFGKFDACPLPRPEWRDRFFR